MDDEVGESDDVDNFFRTRGMSSSSFVLNEVH